MNNLYKEMVRKPGDLCFEVSLESDKGLTMTDLSFALKFFVYGHPKNVCIHKDDLKVVEGKYYAVLNEHGFVNGVLFCEAEIVETINGINRIVSVRSNTGYMIGNCCQSSVDTSSCTHGYSLSLYKVEYVPQPIDPNPEEDQLVAEELFGERLSLPELTADRAIADEHGNRIADTYETRQAVRNHIRAVYNEQFIENPPLIMDGYITPQMLSESTKELLENTGQSINNVPDGEDLTTKQGVLKLSDKPYNPGAYSGLGRVYLRKNLVGGQNLLTQAMVSKPNTIYILQYDYTLDGKSITIPEGCLLSYEGGSIRDGHINYTDTLIHGTDRISNVTTSGTCRHAALPTDEEDITGANGKNLKFKDKEYAPQDYSGLGRIYLRKNIKTVYSEAAQGNVTINLLEQSMIDKPNTIYIIQYDYDLNGAEITIPEGCVFQFEGGVLNNGTIIGNNTAVKAGIIKIFGFDINFKGSWDIDESYPEWFGPTGDDWTLAINKALASFTIIVLTKSSYKVSDTLNMRYNTTLRGRGSAKTQLSYTNIDSSLNKRVLTYGESYDYNGDRGTIEHISFSANTYLQWKGIISYSSIKLYDVYFGNLRSAIKITGDYNDRVIIDRCHFYWCTPKSTDTEYVIDLSPTIGDGYNIINNHLVCFGIGLNNGVDYYGMRLQNLSATNVHSNIINAPIVAINCEGLNIQGLHQEYKGGVDGNLPAITLERVVGSISNVFTFACTKGNIRIIAGDLQGRSSVELSNIGFMYSKERIKELTSVNQINKDKGTILKIQNCFLKDIMQSVGQYMFVGIRVKDNNEFNNLSYIASIESTIGLNNEVILPNFVNTVGSDANCYYSARNSQVTCDNDEYSTPMMYHTLAIVDFQRRLSLGNSQGKQIGSISSPYGVLLSFVSLGNTPINMLVCKKRTSDWTETYNKYAIVPCSTKVQQLKDNGLSVNGFEYIETEEEFSINSFTKITRYYYINGGRNIALYYYKPITDKGEFVEGDIIINNSTDYKTTKWVYKNGLWIDDNLMPYNAKVEGNTSNRPTNIPASTFYFDTTLNKPIWWTGTKWVDATGTEV